MRQRLGIADALIKEPRVLILDEPTIGIDPEGTRELLELIRNLRDERGVTVLLSSHLLYQVQSICDRVGIFVKGKLVAQGPVRELAARHTGTEVVTEVAVDNWEKAGEAIWTVPGVQRIDRQADTWLVVSERDIRTNLSRVLGERGIGLLHLKRRDEGLDEIYTRYFEE
jgi:ABC-2 type transport system ATP-binding protein